MTAVVSPAPWQAQAFSEPKHPSGDCTNSLSLSFEPQAENQDNLMAPPDLFQYPMAHRILTQFTQPLIEVGRRARRVGPPDSGTLVLLAGCQRTVGCSTMALTLAAATAMQETTALVDADLGTRGLTQLLLDRVTAGWDDVVFATASMEQAVHYVDSRERLAFFANRGAANFFSQHAYEELSSWLSQLRRNYPLVYLDGGSIEGAIHWAPWVDTVLIACDSKRFADSEWKNTWDQFEEAGAHVLGIVETFV